MSRVSQVSLVNLSNRKCGQMALPSLAYALLVAFAATWSEGAGSTSRRLITYLPLGLLATRERTAGAVRAATLGQ